jgi:hypothetical protein
LTDLIPGSSQSTATTTTVTTSTATQTGTQLIVNSQANTVSVGNFVTDVSIQPYIASRIISFQAINMRPNHLMHIFFDGVNIDQYCAPGIINYNITDTSDYTQIQKNGNWGDPISTDSEGTIAGQFNIPDATFKTGDRLLQITDVSNLVEGNTAYSTISSAYFTASNLSVTKQSVTLTTVNPVLSYVPISNTVVSTNTTVSITNIPDIVNVTAYYEPIAQGLTINTPNGEAGIYATSLDLFFNQKSLVSNNGVTVYLCEINNGYPDGNHILPFSTVHLPYSNVNVSADSTAYTRFTFEAPVFLNNSTEYAFIVKPDANDPDYYVYSANLGDIDISTGYQVFSQPTIGTAFYGASMNEWTALQTEYIKFRLNRASFTQNKVDAYFDNANTEYLNIFNIGYVNNSVDFLPGDYVFQSTNSTVSTVNTSINGILNYFDADKNVLYVSSSTGNFTSNTYIQIHRFANSTTITPNTSTLISYANTGILHDIKLNSLVGQFASLVPAGTGLSFSYRGTNNTYSIDTNEYNISSGFETDFYDYERVILSKSNEISKLSGNKSFTIHAALTTDSEYVSPLLDTVRYNELVLSNEIDPTGFYYSEFLNNGVAKTKYISQIVTLAAGQDAQDIQVILSAYRPPATDIQVWIKFLNGDDGDSITQKTWTPLILQGSNIYSDPSNPTDFNELTYTVAQGYGMIPTTGTITATNTSVNIVGNNTLFSTDVNVGWYINMPATPVSNELTRQIVAISSNTALTLDQPFTGNYINIPYFLVPPPTTAWLSSNSMIQLGSANGLVVYANGQSVATVTANTSSNMILGSNTNFTTLSPRVTISINGDEQQITGVINATALTVGTPWSSSVSGANVYTISQNGVTYFNTTSNMYTTFKRFQIKVVLQSNDSSQVPILDNLRALALQL